MSSSSVKRTCGPTTFVECMKTRQIAPGSSQHLCSAEHLGGTPYHVGGKDYRDNGHGSAALCKRVNPIDGEYVSERADQRSTRANYRIESSPGCRRPSTESLIAGNCVARTPKTGPDKKPMVLIQNSPLRWPGSVFVI